MSLSWSLAGSLADSEYGAGGAAGIGVTETGLRAVVLAVSVARGRSSILRGGSVAQRMRNRLSRVSGKTNIRVIGPGPDPDRRFFSLYVDLAIYKTPHTLLLHFEVC